MPYPQVFLDIQLTFARKMAALTSQPLSEAVLRNTALYRILGLDWSLDPQDPVWQRFLAALEDGGTSEGGSRAAAYRIYLERYDEGLIPDYTIPRWGCFSYEYAAKERAIRLHFGDVDVSGYGPLSHLRRVAREGELRVLFSHIRQAHPAAEQVQGGSWLYNREAYRRLFPPTYVQSARPDHPHLIARGLWGQFLRHGNRLNEPLAEQFLARVADLRDASQHAGCFPYQVLLTEAPIACFYEHYGIGDS